MRNEEFESENRKHCFISSLFSLSPYRARCVFTAAQNVLKNGMPRKSCRGTVHGGVSKHRLCTVSVLYSGARQRDQAVSSEVFGLVPQNGIQIPLLLTTCSLLDLGDVTMG